MSAGGKYTTSKSCIATRTDARSHIYYIHAHTSNGNNPFPLPSVSISSPLYTYTRERERKASPPPPSSPVRFVLTLPLAAARTHRPSRIASCCCCCRYDWWSYTLMLEPLRLVIIARAGPLRRGSEAAHSTPGFPPRGRATRTHSYGVYIYVYRYT